MIVDIVNIAQKPEICGVWLSKGKCQYMSRELNGCDDFTLHFQMSGLAGTFGYWVKTHPQIDQIWKMAIKEMNDIIDDSDFAKVHGQAKSIRDAIIDQKINRQLILTEVCS